jgi:hypothetical protein
MRFTDPLVRRHPQLALGMHGRPETLLPGSSSRTVGSSAALLLSSDSGSGGTVYTKGPAGTSLHMTTSRMVGRDLGTLCRQW